MRVVSSHKDAEALTLTVVTEFDTSVERLWQVWQDPRQVERWWGPPGWPATFERHDLVVGGESRYHMTGPDGEISRGWWRFTAIEPPHRLEFDDGFAGEDGRPVDTMPPTHTAVTIEAAGAGARMTTVTKFATLEHLEQVLAMGADEAFRLALGQIDAVLDAEKGRD
jgi:uncharacterized protein YndB with AHSA1/START domain